MLKKTPMQADGGGDVTKRGSPTGIGAKKERSTESNGGAYPNPNTDNKDGNKEIGTFGDHGGQSGIGYSGPDNENATTKGK